MDPLSALGLAANIGQFIEVAIKLFLTSKEYYTSKDGSVGSFQEIQHDNDRLAFLTTRLQSCTSANKVGSGPPTGEHALHQIAEECQIISNDLGRKMVKMQKSGRNGAWESFHLAVKNLWQEGHVKERVARLTQLKADLCVHMLAMLTVSRSDAHDELLKQLSSHQIELLNAINQLQTLVVLRPQHNRRDSNNVQDIISIQNPSLRSHVDKLNSQLVERIIVAKEGFLSQARGMLDLERCAVAHISDIDHSNRTGKVSLAEKYEDAAGTQKIVVQREWEAMLAADILSRSEDDWAASMSTSQLREESQQDYILRCLSFEAMEDRSKFIIKPPHARTFSWVFAPPSDLLGQWNSFSYWLSDEKSTKASHPPIYWIAGKPGSGKSTLMRFIWTEPATREIASRWAAHKKLLVASCFLWAPGIAMQKSFCGLLRTLLHGLLSDGRDLISSLMSRRWRDLQLDLLSSEPWSEQELVATLLDLVATTTETHCVLLLIDGLDEYEGDQEQRENVILLLKELADHSHVKICVSSRPWPIFHDAFEGYPSLLLEKLTKPDIKAYVDEVFVQDRRFKRLSEAEPQQCRQLIATLLDMAQGVFLWVHLVLQSLKESLQDDFRVDDLFRQLKVIPDDLHEFFRFIFDSIPMKHRFEAAKILQIALESPRLSVMSLYWINEPEPKFCDVQTVVSKPLSESAIHNMQEGMKKRIKSRCKELLEVHSETDCELDGSRLVIGRWHLGFLHRTVHDFLKRPEIIAIRTEYEVAGFNPDYYLLQATLLQIAMAKRTFERDLVQLLKQLFLHGRNCEMRWSQDVTDIFSKAERLLYKGFKPMPDPFSAQNRGVYCLMVNHPDQFFAQAVKYKVRGYALKRMLADPGLCSHEYLHLSVHRSVSFVAAAFPVILQESPVRAPDPLLIALALLYGGIRITDLAWFVLPDALPHGTQADIENLNQWVQVYELLIRAAGVQPQVVDFKLSNLPQEHAEKLTQLWDSLKISKSWVSRKVKRLSRGPTMHERLKLTIIPSPEIEEVFQRDLLLHGLDYAYPKNFPNK